MTFMVTVLWLAVNYRLLWYYLRTLINFSPFITAYLLLSLLTDLSFPKQLFFVGRICLMLLFSVFLFKTTNAERFLAETYTIRRWKPLNSIVAFCLATVIFVKLFFNEIKIVRYGAKRLEGIINIIVDSFTNVYRQIDSIEEIVTHLATKDFRTEDEEGVTAKCELFNGANIYLTFLLSLFVVIMAL
jgi:hypothetical protein